MSNFLYCHDPLDESVGEYLLHLGDPAAIIKIISLEEEEAIESDEFVHKVFLYEDDEISEEYQLIFTPFTSAANALQPSEEAITDILDAAWEYWVQVLQWEEDEDEDE